MEEYHILDQGLSRKSHLKTQLLHVRFGSKADIGDSSNQCLLYPQKRTLTAASSYRSGYSAAALLWLINGHSETPRECPLCSRKQTSRNAVGIHFKPIASSKADRTSAGCP